LTEPDPGLLMAKVYCVNGRLSRPRFMLARGGGDKILTAIEAAELIGVTPRRVLQFCEEQRFASARRIELNQRWVVLESDVRAHVPRLSGRPRKSR
jgi:hypothetical protein